MEQPLLALIDELAHGVAAHVVTHRRHHAEGLVEGQVDPGGVQLHSVAVDVHDLLVGVDADAEFGDDLVIDHDPAGHDQFFAGAAAADTGGGEQLL